MVENPTENRGSKRAINRRKPNETEAFRRINSKISTAGMPGNETQKTLIYRQLKIQNGILYRGESAMSG
jgi:hypothetical protein